MKKIIVVGAALVAALAAAEPITYSLTVSSSREVDAASAETAAAFGIPALTRVDTAATFTLEPVEGGGYRLTFVTASQQTLAGEATVPDVEKVGASLPGRWVEFSPKSLGAGGVKRSPELTKDSEEISYNLLAIMLMPPGGPMAAAWGGPVKAAVVRYYGVGIVSVETAEATPLPAFEGAPAGQLDFQVNFVQNLSQNTNVSTMTGGATFEGAGSALAAPDGLAAAARLDLTGSVHRAFTIFGGTQKLGESATIALRLVRAGSELPAEWRTEGEPAGDGE